MISLDMYSGSYLRTEAAAYPCGVCPPGAPCWPPPPPSDESSYDLAY
jgi:hypothetical protein